MSIHRMARFTLILPLVCLAGCTVHLIAPYDATLDNSMTEIQKDSELFFNQLQDAQGTDAGSYQNTKTYYLHTEATLKTLLTRAQAVPKSDRISGEIKAIEATVELMQKTHERDKSLNSSNLAGYHQTLADEFQFFFTLELALKNHSATPAKAAMAPTI